MTNLILPPGLRENLPPLEALEAEKSRRKRNKILRYYPDEGPLRRELYKKHCEIFAAGKDHPERLMIAANRIGKTEGVGAFETSLHLTGRYPDWWTGKRFSHPIKGWAAGDTSKTVREILQEKLLGRPGELGTGMIPADAIANTRPRTGIPDAVEMIYVRHVAGGNSILLLKSYDQRREAFQGTEQDWIWLDEEPPEDIYTECVMRTMATGAFKGGSTLLTFTPVNGWTEVVAKFLDDDQRAKAGRCVVTATWDDAPHLSQSEKDRLFASLPPYQRDARSKGIPALGSGAIYPVPDEDIVVPDFEIPAHWPRSYGMDVGWKRTACVWGAWDRQNDVRYLYSEHYRGEAEPSIHATAIRARGEWIKGAIDPAARGRSQIDGRRLIDMYRALGLHLIEAENAVESGIYELWQRMSTGRLKVFRSLTSFLEERRRYRRDDKGRVVKQNDHLMDASRYFDATPGAMAVKPAPPAQRPPSTPSDAYSWMG